MRVNADLADHRIPFLGYISVAVLRIGPRPAGKDHLLLQIIVAGIALRDRAVVLAVIVYFAARDRPAANDPNQCFSRQRPPKSFAVVTRLEFFRRINPKQANDLTTKLHGIAIRDSEAVRGSFAVDIGVCLRKCLRGRSPK